MKPTSPASADEKTIVTTSQKMRILRRSTISASAPAGRAKRQYGKLVATWTIETISGEGLRLVISQPDAALYIQPPIFEMTVAVQMTANVLCRNGLQAEFGRWVEGVAGSAISSRGAKLAEPLGREIVPKSKRLLPSHSIC
jgi:hypothetical protein